VKLVKGASAKSFARVETNQSAVLHRGWGPKVLNMNVLLHPEIVATKHLTSKNSCTTFNGPSSLLLPSELNISEGLAGTLVDHIVLKATEKLPPEVVLLLRSPKSKRRLQQKNGEP
jgi:hypothetical protein